MHKEFITALKKEYQKSIDIQNVSNLSAIANDFAGAFNIIWTEAHDRGLGTDFVNSHPIVQLYLSKFISLSQHDNIKFGEAYNKAMVVIGKV